MQKSALKYGEIIFQSKVIPLFLPKCFSSIHSIYIWYTYCIPYMEVTDCRFLPYMEVTVGKEKKRQNMAKWGGHQNSKNSNR